MSGENWEQLEIPGVTESFRTIRPRPGYRRVSPEGDSESPSYPAERNSAGKREDDMLTIEIKINDEVLHRAEAYLQPGGVLEGVCAYKVVINDVDAGVIQHDRRAGAWILARQTLDAFSAPEKTLQAADRDTVDAPGLRGTPSPSGEGGAHTRRCWSPIGLRSTEEDPTLGGFTEQNFEAENREAVDRVRQRMQQENWPSDDVSVAALLRAVMALSPEGLSGVRDWAQTEEAAASAKLALEEDR